MHAIDVNHVVFRLPRPSQCENVKVFYVFTTVAHSSFPKQHKSHISGIFVQN